MLAGCSFQLSVKSACNAIALIFKSMLFDWLRAAFSANQHKSETNDVLHFFPRLTQTGCICPGVLHDWLI